MKNLNLKFGGFYGSIHESNIDMMVEDYYYNENYEDRDINYPLIFEKYSRAYLGIFQEWLQDEYFKNCKLHFVYLFSPTYYNYRTDEININISNDLEYKIYHLLIRDVVFLGYLKEETTSFDGYISFYSFDEVLKNKDNIFASFGLNYLVDKFNDEDFEQYYDINNLYELLYQLKTIETEKGA